MELNHFSQSSSDFHTSDALRYQRSRISSSFSSRSSRRSRISTRDASWCIVLLLCLSAATVSVFWAPAAVFLGQVNQLIVVGFLLAVMATIVETLIIQTALIHAGTRKSLTMQDLDALLRKDSFAAKAHLGYRILLLLIIGIPLGLSVAYKNFIGGHSVVSVRDKSDGFFGCASTPGKQRIGDGISILTDIYVPFWIDPAENKTYGFNLFIMNNYTAAVLDSPFPEYLSSLQGSLETGESLILTTTVNATVAQMVNPTDEERSNDTYWESVSAYFDHDPAVNGGNVNGANNALLAGSRAEQQSNFSVTFFSAWNSTKNETFESEAIRIEHTRRLATGVWRITSSNITLTSAVLIENSQTLADQVLIQNNLLSIQELFSTLLGEFDWHNRAGAFDFPYPGPPNAQWRFSQPVNTVPALSAAMMWARFSSLETIDRPLGIQNKIARTLTGYDKLSDEIFMMKEVPTLRRSPLLLLVLMVNPVLALICVSLSAYVWHHSPIGGEFTAISLVNAVSTSVIQYTPQPLQHQPIGQIFDRRKTAGATYSPVPL